MLLGPAAWVRGAQVPQCAREWPSAIFLAFSGDRGPARERIAAARSFDGVPWVGWLLPRPSTDDAPGWRALAPRVLEEVRALNAGGVVINPEAEWFDVHDDEARAFVDWFQSRGVSVVVSTFAIPPARFPLRGFARADAGLPLTFDRDVQTDRTYVERSALRWRAAGWTGRLLVSAGLWNHRERRPKTAEETRAHLAQRPRDAIVWGPPVWTRAQCAEVERWQRGTGARPAASASSTPPAAIAAALVALFSWLFRDR